MVAEEAREIMADLGVRSIDELIGRVDLLDARKTVKHWKSKKIDLRALLVNASELREGVALRKTVPQNHGIKNVLDRQLIKDAKESIKTKEQINLQYPITNTNRTTGAMLSHKVTSLWGEDGLPNDTIKIDFKGSAGQSFGAFLSKGITFNLLGDANDYVGKGLSGGRIIVAPPKMDGFIAQQNIIIGNVALYGATSGFGFFKGIAAERFCVRNSGARAVVEGVGDHACEYMTGGRVVILGPTGVNFAAGMSGGIAYVYDPHNEFEPKCNTGMVELETTEDQESIAELLRMVELHQRYTQSEVAAFLLNDWENNLEKFVKVMPQDYKRVMTERREHNEEIESIIEVKDRKSERPGV
jgi:glutamate synthase (NADPH/NADH) large chain